MPLVCHYTAGRSSTDGLFDFSRRSWNIVLPVHFIKQFIAPQASRHEISSLKGCNTVVVTSVRAFPEIFQPEVLLRIK